MSNLGVNIILGLKLFLGSQPHSHVITRMLATMPRWDWNSGHNAKPCQGNHRWSDINAATSVTMSRCNQNADNNVMSWSESRLQCQTLPRKCLGLAWLLGSQPQFHAAVTRMLAITPHLDRNPGYNAKPWRGHHPWSNMVAGILATPPRCNQDAGNNNMVWLESLLQCQTFAKIFALAYHWCRDFSHNVTL